jgi:uncharacterized delta-60 repeat protein
MMHGLRHRTLVGMVALAVAASLCAQAPFALDTTFRTGFIWNHPGVYGISSVLPLPDGKMLASGVMRYPGELEDRRFVRLLPDGSRDMSFPPPGPGTNVGGGGKITPWNDRLYVANNYAVRRVLYSGHVDTSFAVGMGVIPYFSPFEAGDFHVFPDGRMVISGRHILSDTIRGFLNVHMFVWFTSTGQLDTTRIHRKANGPVRRFKELPDGKFIASGGISSFAGQPSDAIFRLHADGALDTTFRTGVNWGEAVNYLPLADGRVYVVGRFRRALAPLDTLRLVRMLPDGSLDPTFTAPHFTLGAIPDPAGLGAGVNSITPWPDGNLVVTGPFQYVNGHERRGICMIDSSGTLLDAFAGHGVWPYLNNLPGGGVLPHASLARIVPYDADRYLVWGSYEGYGDGNVNDMEQRLITRIHGAEGPFLPVGLREAGTVSARPVLRLYPNPGGEALWIERSEGMRGRATLLVRDARGALTGTWPMNGGTLRVDAEHWPPGLYLLELTDERGVRATAKWVRQ